MYVEMKIDEAIKRCNKNARVLVSIQDLEQEDVDILFIKKEKKDYNGIFKDVKTVASACDDFVKQLKLFTEKQDIHNIKPKGMQKIILLRE